MTKSFQFLAFLLILSLIIYFSNSDPANSPSLPANALPSKKLLGVGLVKLGMNDPELPALRMFSAPVFPASKNLWNDLVARNILVDDQGQFGSCTACALSYSWQQAIVRSSEAFFRPSRTFWYAESRKRLGDTNYRADNGSTISDTAWVLTNMGALPETQYPYNATNIQNAVPASIKTVAAARKRATRQVNFSRSVNTNVINFKTEINAGRLIMIGVLVYTSFMSRTTMRSGNIPVPNTRRERLLGGHAIALSGWNDSTRTFSFRNSWGTGVGQRGLFHIPYSYVCNGSLAGDAWVVA